MTSISPATYAPPNLHYSSEDAYLDALADAMSHVAFARPSGEVLRWTRELLDLVRGRGACHLPDGAANMVASALRVFAADLRQHAERGPCGRAARAPVLPLPEAGAPDLAGAAGGRP